MNPILYPLFWLILALILGIIEAATVQLVAIWFAIGALGAIVPALLRGPMWMQLTVFLGVSILMLLFTRPFLYKILRVRKQSTNADSVIGTVGIVTDGIENDYGRGRVDAMGLSWTARSWQEGTIIPAGTKVEVLRIEGVKLIVKPKE